MADLAAPPRAPARTQVAFRVLVVDDDPDMLSFLELMLKKEGLDTETVGDGESALARVSAQQPDLILLDVMLPGISGFEVCERLKAGDDTALIPIVLITALEDQASRVRGIESGADDFLSKPVKREELLARVKTLRRLHETRRELENRRLAAEIQRKEAMRRAFVRYISPRLADRLLRESEAKPDDTQNVFRDLTERAAVVTLFADLRGFTRMSETVPVSMVVPLLNEYFSVLTAAAHESEGTVFSMSGDSLLVGFNVPIPQADAGERALNTARVMIQRFAPIARSWKRRHGLDTGVGVGIEAGEVVVGNVGAPSFMSYTIIGDAVNVAARLMQMAASNEILVGPSACLALRPVLGAAAAQYQREVTVRGKAEPLRVLSLKVQPD